MDLAAGVRYLRIPDRYYELQLERLLRDRPRATRPDELFADANDEFWVWVLTEGYRRSEAVPKLLPGLPDEQVQLTTNGIAGDHALIDGFLVYRMVREIFHGLGGDLSNATVLDFGVGWGRVLRFFMKDVEASRLVGIDHHRPWIEIGIETFPAGGPRFLHTEPFPPAPFPDGSFDLVFAYSVFSHLSDEANIAWAREFARLLRPGGVVVATTWDRELIVRCGAAAAADAGPDVPFFQTHFATMFQPTTAWLLRYDAGELCFDSSQESYGDVSSYLGEACVPEAWVRKHWGQHLEVVDYIVDRSVSPQNVIVATR